MKKFILILCISIFISSIAFSNATFTGTWKTAWGNVTLTQEGNQVTGTYAYRGGKITGTVEGNVLTFKWEQSEDNDSGSGEFTLSEDGNSFTGKWQSSDGSRSGQWNGQKAEE